MKADEGLSTGRNVLKIVSVKPLTYNQNKSIGTYIYFLHFPHCFHKYKQLKNLFLNKFYIEVWKSEYSSHLRIKFSLQVFTTSACKRRHHSEQYYKVCVYIFTAVSILSNWKKFQTLQLPCQIVFLVFKSGDFIFLSSGKYDRQISFTSGQHSRTKNTPAMV